MTSNQEGVPTNTHSTILMPLTNFQMKKVNFEMKWDIIDHTDHLTLFRESEHWVEKKNITLHKSQHGLSLSCVLKCTAEFYFVKKLRHNMLWQVQEVFWPGQLLYHTHRHIGKSFCLITFPN
jgi:hypothetical protein